MGLKKLGQNQVTDANEQYLDLLLCEDCTAAITHLIRLSPPFISFCFYFQVSKTSCLELDPLGNFIGNSLPRPCVSTSQIFL